MCDEKCRALKTEMTTCYFYALGDDRTAIAQLIYRESDCRIYESSSVANQDLRCFDTFDEFMAGYKDEISDGSIVAYLHSPNMKGNLRFERQVWEEKAWRAAGTVVTPHGWGLIQLDFGWLKDGEV